MSEATPKPPPPVSELFKRAVVSAGSIVIDCDFCGRTHFGDGSGDYEYGELERLLESQRQEPNKFVQHLDSDMVSYGYLAGKKAVLECECNHLRLYENFIWSHRKLIAFYLKSRCAEILRDAQSDMEDAKSIPMDVFPDQRTKRVFDLK